MGVVVFGKLPEWTEAFYGDGYGDGYGYGYGDGSGSGSGYGYGSGTVSQGRSGRRRS